MKTKMPVWRMFTVFILLAVLLAGCGKAPAASQDSSGGKAFLTIKDDSGRDVVLEHKPEKIVVLSPSFLDVLYAVGGKAVGRPSSKNGDIPAAAQQVTEIGYVYNINMEQVAALQPDLVIAYQGIHEKLIPLLESNHIPYIMVRLKTYQDILDKLKLFGAIAGTPQKGEEVAAQMDGRVQKLLGSLPKQPVKVAILHTTAKSVTVELENSIAGNVAKELKLTNIAAGTMAGADPDSAPFSLEKLVEANPDMIMVTTMGQTAEIEKRMRADVESNPAWAGLTAVKQHKVYYLPQELFLLHPGLKYPEAIEYMAKLAYPGAVQNGQ
ncbi:ABC transporter substrate-binding protein [Propionispora hippei]|uniref:Iron complex transport system substrate-binding protein n=1 Tax=Propionispora hippei DSM 15287 TaxID=1123003 RepID=A0A1M6KZV0_9FIRM|nr:ABC transporter substrate-binding protein [Propionispora hippei]SHJ64437.1 iron complex transport system substrate-binding protein [Propionispora hippei DSM 15287]